MKWPTVPITVIADINPRNRDWATLPDDSEITFVPMSAGRCLTGVAVLLSTSVSATESPQRDRGASCVSRPCPVLTVTGPPSSVLASPGQASHGPAAASPAGPVAPACGTSVPRGTRRRSKRHASRGPSRPVGCVTPHGGCLAVPPRGGRQETTGPGAPAGAPAPVPGAASRAGRGGEVPLRGRGATAWAARRTRREVGGWRAAVTAAGAVAGPGSPAGPGGGGWGRTAAGRGLPAGASAGAALWSPDVVHGRLGSLRAPGGRSATPRGAGGPAPEREPAPPAAAPAHAARAAPAVFCQDRPSARSQHGAV